MRDWPISKRLTGMLVFVSALVLLFTSAAFAGFQFWSFRSSEREWMMVRGEVMALNATAALAFQDQVAASEMLATLRADPHVVAAAIYDANGDLFATYPAGVDAALLPEPPLEPGYRFADGLLIGHEPIAVEGGSPLGTLFLASDLTALYDTLRLSVLVGALLFLVALGAAYALSNVLHRSISRPILALAQTARAISTRRDYSVRAPDGGGGELSELTGAFNHMLAHIEAQNRELLANEDELRTHALELEQKVAERTAELQASNAALVQQAADLQAANAELDAFAYSVSHDLRAPLRTIDGFSQVVLEDYGDVLDEEGRNALGRVRTATQRMGALIDSMLRLARISRYPMSPERVDVSALAADLVAELRRLEPEREVEVVIEPDMHAWADRRLLEIALDNLIRNAWKYTSRKPAARIEIASIEEDGQRSFVVRDNGAGFDMQYAGKLFGEFQRLHSQEEFEGTGVGLATVRRIIRRHGGDIRAEGAVGVGASFYFRLPEPILSQGVSA